MNHIDKLELLSNLSSIRREAKALLADPTGAGHAARLRRILMILSYMREHLEMVAMPHGKDERKESPAAAAPSIDEPHQASDLP
jgi:hypothetical protein